MGKWSDDTRKLLRELAKFKPQDRLGHVTFITMNNFAIARSINGWTGWLTDARIMNNFSEEKLREISRKFKKFAIEFLKFDEDVTRDIGVQEQEPPKNNKMII